MAIQTKMDAAGKEYTEIWSGTANSLVKSATFDIDGMHAAFVAADPLLSETNMRSPLIMAGNTDAEVTARTGGTVRAPDVATGGAGNVAGANLTIRSGKGTGTGAPGSIVFQTAPVTTAGDNGTTPATVATVTSLGMTMAKPLAGTPDVITAASGGTAASVATLVTAVTTDGDSDEDNVTLANGTVVGQLKVIVCNIVGNAADSFKVTPATMLGGTKITFAANPIGKGCTMVWNAAGWSVVGHNGGTIA